MNEKYFVWQATTNDMDALVALESAAFAARSWGQESVRQSIAAPKVEVLLIGFKQSSPLGFIMWRDLEGEAEILSIGVGPSARKNGLGGALIAAVREAAVKSGVRKMFLEVDAGNTAALALYSRAGFERAGIRKAYYRDGAAAILMQAEI